MMIAKFNSTALAAIFGLALSFVGMSADATNLVTNGSFETLSGGIGQIGYNGTNLTGWTNGSVGGTLGYNFVYSAGSADTTGANGDSGNVKLWGPNDGSANGFTGASPDGGNFIAADGAYQVAPISQTVSGLTSGNQYTVSFWWAGAQQSGFSGTTTEQWLVSLGAQQLATSVVTDANHGFTGWMYTSLTFTATGSSEVLSFLAAGTPSGEPPFSLLDGVTMVQAVPEPGSVTLLAAGLIGLAYLVRRRQLSRA
jgi:hypothetical protein